MSRWWTLLNDHALVVQYFRVSVLACSMLRYEDVLWLVFIIKYMYSEVFGHVCDQNIPLRHLGGVSVLKI